MSSKHKSKKDRRHSGRFTPNIINPEMKYSDIIIEALEPQSEYNEWLSWKDGFRDFIYLKWKKKDKEKSKKKYKILSF